MNWPTLTVKGTIAPCGGMTLTEIAKSAPLMLSPGWDVTMIAPEVPTPKENPMQKDALMAAVAAWKDRRAEVERLRSGDLVPPLLRYRVPKNKIGRGMAHYAPEKGYTCRKCERFRIESNDPKVALRHMATVPHLAQEFEVSPFALAAAIRGVRVMGGDNPDAGKRNSKRRGRWNKNMTADSAVRHASLMLARWQKKLEKTHDKVITWARRLKNAQARIAKDTHHESEHHGS